MVTHVEHGSSAEGTLRTGDVLMEVDGVKLANDGSSVFLGQRLAMVAILQARFIGDEVPVKLLRDGKETEVVVTLKSLRSSSRGGSTTRARRSCSSAVCCSSP